MKRLLIVFPIQHHESLVLGQCVCLNKNGISADALLINEERIRYSFRGIKKANRLFVVCSYLYKKLRNVRGYYRFGIGDYLKQQAFRSIVNSYDIVELAGVYSEDRLSFAKYAQSKGIKVITRVWGTDFYGIKDFQNDWRKELFNIADKIVFATDKMNNDFISTYKSLIGKTAVQNYGLSQLEQLKDILDGKEDKDISFLSEDAKGKIVLTIGYTGRTWQQHFYVIDALEKLSQEQKDKLFVLIPMTYDSIPDYMLYVYKRMQVIGIPFQLLDKRLSLKQNLSMRIISDIAVCVQFSDALAASVQEHIMAGSVFVGGDWLPYGEIQDKGIYMKRSGKDSLASVIGDIIDNIEEEKAQCQRNKEIQYSFSSWKFKDNQLLQIYNTQ